MLVLRWMPGRARKAADAASAETPERRETAQV